MAKIASKIDARSAEFAANSKAMQALAAELRATLQRNALGGTAAARDKHWRHASATLYDPLRANTRGAI